MTKKAVAPVSIVTIKALSEDVSASVGMTKQFGREFAKALSLAIASALAEGSVVSIPGVGRIRPVKRSARVWHNPRNNDTISLPESRAVKFTASKPLLELLNGHDSLDGDDGEDAA